MARLCLARRLGFLLACVGNFGCGGGNGGDMGPPQGFVCAGGSASTQVSVGDNVFNPASVSVPMNGAVTWTWTGTNPHNVTFQTGPQPLPATSCTQMSGTHTVTFTTAGQYEYHCSIHVGMNGSVTVTP